MTLSRNMTLREETGREPGPQEISALVAMFNQKRYTEMEDLARKMTASFPSYGIGWKAMGTALLQQGRNEEALIPLQKAANFSPKDAQPYNSLGNTFLKLNRPSEAEASLRRALELKPDYAEAHFNLGDALGGQGRLSEAEASYRRSLELKPDFAEAHCKLGDTLQRQGRLPEAEISYCRALELKPNFTDAHNNLGIIKGERPAFSVEHDLTVLFSTGRHAALEERMSSLLNQYPNWGAGWDMLCTALQIQGKESEDALERALQLMPEVPGNRQKVFCIGANKTGTTSVKHVFGSLGLTVGNQGQAEMLLYDWAKQDYRRLIKYCQLSEAFQDVPFSFHGTFKAMDKAFPASRFILTVRNDANEWYDSLVRFHTKIMGKGRIPTADDLRQFNYRFPGFLWDWLRLSYGAGESMLYNREVYAQYYEAHNNQVIEYFKDRPSDLLVLNVAEPSAIERLVKFLGYPYMGQKMPHINSSQKRLAA